MQVPALLAARLRRLRLPVERARARLVFTSCEVEHDRAARRRRTRTAISVSSSSARCSRPASTRTPTGSSSARSTWGRESRARSSAAPGTSAPAPRSPSRCPARCCPAPTQPLGEAKLRGEVSRGMILSERELELGADHTGIMVLRGRAEPGTPLADVLPLTTTCSTSRPAGNRVDLLSVYGIAREVAALYRRGARAAAGHRSRSRAGDEPVDIRVEDFEGCPRYVGRLFRGVAIGPSPPWLKARLLARRDAPDLERRRRHELRHARARLARCTPSTARSLAGGRIVVRRAQRGEKIRTLDGVERELDDRRPRDRRRGARRSRSPGSWAARRRGRATRRPRSCSRRRTSSRSRCCGRSRAAEAAHGGLEALGEGRRPVRAPSRRRSTRRSCSSSSPARAGRAHRRARRAARAPPVVRSGPSARTRLIGLEIPADEQRRAPAAARLRGRRRLDGDGADVARRDVTREVDLVEEVVRVPDGGGPVDAARRAARSSAQLTPEQRLRRRVEDVLVGAGFRDVHVDARPGSGRAGGWRCRSRCTTERRCCGRRSLHGLRRGGARGSVDVGNERIALFEIARVYLPSGDELPEERWHVAGIVEGGFFAREGRRRGAPPRRSSSSARARPEPLLHPGGPRERGLARRAHPSCPRDVGRTSSSTSTRCSPRVPEPIAVRGRDHVPGRQAGPRVRRRRGRRGRRPDRRGPRGRRPGAARAARLRRLSRRAGRARARSRSRSRLAFQSPERTLSDEDAASCASGSSRRSPSASAPSCAPSRRQSESDPTSRT